MEQGGEEEVQQTAQKEATLRSLAHQTPILELHHLMDSTPYRGTALKSLTNLIM